MAVIIATSRRELAVRSGHNTHNIAFIYTSCQTSRCVYLYTRTTVRLARSPGGRARLEFIFRARTFYLARGIRSADIQCRRACRCATQPGGRQCGFDRGAATPARKVHIARCLLILVLSALSPRYVLAISVVDANSDTEVEEDVSSGKICEARSKKSEDTRMKTVWVIGGPGCGKGTQCDRMIAKYGLLHLSSGDLLREEVSSGSPRGASLQELMSKGLFVPTDVVLDLIKERMAKARAEGTAKGFLIDGYPRELDQGLQFEKDVCPVDVVIFFDVENETLKKRLMGRAAVSQRADDNEETIKKRIEIFNVKNGEIVEHYKDKLVRINAEGSVDDIFAEVTKALDPVLAA